MIEYYQIVIDGEKYSEPSKDMASLYAKASALASTLRKQVKIIPVQLSDDDKQIADLVDGMF